MGNIAKTTAPEAIHVKRCSAITDLARPVDLALKRMALRAEIAAAIADAAKVERAAEALRAAAEPVQGQASLVPRSPTGQLHQQDTWDRDAHNNDLIDRHWRAVDEAPRTRRNGSPEENAITMCILERHDQFGDLKKR